MNFLATLHRFLPFQVPPATSSAAGSCDCPAGAGPCMRLELRDARTVDVRPGGCVECLTGSIRVRRDDEPWDVALSAGEIWSLDRQGCLTISVSDPALVRVTP